MMKTVWMALAMATCCAAAEPEWNWYERDALPLEGRAFKDTGDRYFRRLPARAKDAVNSQIWHMSRNPTGMYIRFRTDADRLAIRWKLSNGNAADPLIPGAGLLGVDVYRLDAQTNKWIFVGNKRYWGNRRDAPPGETEFSWRPGEAGLIYLPTRAVLDDFKVGVPAGKTLQPFPHADPAAKPVVHYGTSIVHGGCASRPGLTFTAIAGRELDRPYVNLGFSGNGRMEKALVPFLAEIDAAVYVVDCTWNMNADMVKTNAVPFLRALRAARPTVPILLCEGCTVAARHPADDEVRRVYETLKTEDPALWGNLFYFSSAGMLEPGDRESTHDFCHPNDIGMRRMGPAYAKRIREVLDATAAGRCALKVDFAADAGPVKPVNGVGQPPLLGWNNCSMFRYLKEAGVPYSRLHDVGGALGKNLFVDIPNLFRNFDADETDPANYDFAFTDILISNLVANAVEPYFRLGITIENAVTTRPYRVYPPKDYAKWARICEHVVRHYTEGWANGFRYRISHWEIWNEPENHPDMDRNPMWRGDFDSYVRLYLTAAKHLKATFPHLRIGGYGSCGFYAVDGTGKVAEGANVSDRYMHFIHCFTNFLDVVRREKAPLDFFSMHSYAAPAPTMMHVRWARERLDEYGFAATGLSVNEWLPRPSAAARGTARQAALVAAEMIGFQNGPVEDAEIYDARCGMSNYSPLFNCLTYRPFKAYHVFRAFNELRRLGRAVRVTGAAEGLWVCAAAGGGKGAVMLANISGRALPLTGFLGGRRPVRTRIIDADRDLEDTVLDGTIPDNTVLLVEVE